MRLEHKLLQMGAREIRINSVLLKYSGQAGIGKTDSFEKEKTGYLAPSRYEIQQAWGVLHFTGEHYIL